MGVVLAQVHMSIGHRLEKVVLDAMSGSQLGPGLRACKANADDSSRTAKAMACVNYWVAGGKQAELHCEVPWSLTCDATRVGKRNVFDAAVIFPSNVGFWLPPKDCHPAMRAQ